MCASSRMRLVPVPRKVADDGLADLGRRVLHLVDVGASAHQLDLSAEALSRWPPAWLRAPDPPRRGCQTRWPPAHAGCPGTGRAPVWCGSTARRTGRVAGGRPQRRQTAQPAKRAFAWSLSGARDRNRQQRAHRWSQRLAQPPMIGLAPGARRRRGWCGSPCRHRRTSSPVPRPRADRPRPRPCPSRRLRQTSPPSGRSAR